VITCECGFDARAADEEGLVAVTAGDYVQAHDLLLEIDSAAARREARGELLPRRQRTLPPPACRAGSDVRRGPVECAHACKSGLCELVRDIPPTDGVRREWL